MADLLTEDLMVEILCRLPLRRLITFRRVSKEWYKLISTVCIPKSFGDMLNRHPSGFLFLAAVGNSRNSSKFHLAHVSYPRGIYCDHRTTGFIRSFAKIFRRSSFMLLDSCHGLLLFTTRDSQYYVCNATTRQHIAVPVHRKDKHYTASLVFDNCTSPHYKIVRFLNLRSSSVSRPVRLDIFSSATGKWVEHSVSLEPSFLLKAVWSDRSIYFDGRLYKQTLADYLLCFDLNKHTAQGIKLPDNLPDSRRYGFVGVSKGHLCYANHDSCKTSICIWLLENGRGDVYSWKLTHCILIRDLMSSSSAFRMTTLVTDVSYTCMPYAIHPSGDEVILGFPRQLLTYNLKTRELEVLFTTYEGQEIFDGQCWFFPQFRCFNILHDFSKLSTP